MNNFDYESWMLTGDLKIAEVRWVVQYKIKDAAEYLFNVKNVKNTINYINKAYKYINTSKSSEC